MVHRESNINNPCVLIICQKYLLCYVSLLFLLGLLAIVITFYFKYDKTSIAVLSNLTNVSSLEELVFLSDSSS